MSNKTQLQTNNTQLASLIQTLQGKAAGGGSGGSVETCTVVLKDMDGASSLYQYLFTTYENDTISNVYYTFGNEQGFEISIPNVVCGAMFYLNAYFYDSSLEGGLEIIANDNGRCFIKAPTTAGSISTFEMYGSD